MNMEEFYRWLKSPTKPSETYRLQLSSLTQATCEQITNLKSDLVWELWFVNKPAKAH